MNQRIYQPFINQVLIEEIRTKVEEGSLILEEDNTTFKIKVAN